MYCFDTDVLSAVLRRDPPLRLIRRLASVPAEQQFTTSITLGELLYGAESARAPVSLIESGISSGPLSESSPSTKLRPSTTADFAQISSAQADR